MESQEIRKKFLDFFEKRGHKIVPSSSLIPDDPSVLLTTAGMQQFKKYYTGEADPIKDFGVRNTASIQKSFRTSDIDEVGDESHLTFFEMLGNFSFGGYFKEEAIRYAFEFFKLLNLPIGFVTVFGGDGEVPADEESEKIWRNLGISKIEKRGREDNFWGPTGNEGPCGPTTEIYVKPAGDNSGGVEGIEVWNIVFNEYYCRQNKSLDKLKQNGVDTGMGLERLSMMLQQKRNIFETDLFAPLFELLPNEISPRHQRIIVDHLRGSAFLLADGVRPSNKEAGYILRRLMRRTLVYEYLYKIPLHAYGAILHDIIHEYGMFYPELQKNNEVIREEFEKERNKFGKTIGRGIKELEKINEIDEAAAFNLYQTYGLPYEIIKELGKERAQKLRREYFDREFKKHQEISRAGQERKFGGHGLLLDTGELKAVDERELKIVTRLHTATHLLNAALRKILGPEIEQQGSDITALRTRFDFTFPRKLTPEEIRKVEEWVNEVIRRDAKVEFQEMPYDEAVKTGAIRFWREKYPPRVKVYKIYDQQSGEIFSQELCGGPHVTHTAEIGKFKITKEESSSAGVRRIRAVVE
jgi:alanyl-tRNA synthetase